MQSLGRYHDIMSHENFEQEFETLNHDGHNATRQEVVDLYNIDDSYDSLVPQQRIAAHQNKQIAN